MISIEDALARRPVDRENVERHKRRMLHEIEEAAADEREEDQ